MSILASLNTGVSALSAFGTAIATISTNIANVNTTGYKTSNSIFQSLVAGGSNASVGGGVLNKTKNFISQQGVLQATNSNTDLAISGNGFFAAGKVSETGEIFDVQYLRAGNFVTDSAGNFVVASSPELKLLAWALDSQGNAPGEGTNPDTTPKQLISSLSAVNIQAVVSSANPTTAVDFSFNLDSTTEQFFGATDAIDLASLTNTANDLDDIVVPQSWNSGDDFSIIYTTDGITATASFTYTSSVSNPISGTILGADDVNEAFTANNNDIFTITVDGVDYEFTYKTSNPSQSNFEFNTMTNLAAAINQTGQINARVDGGILYIADDAGRAVTFTAGGTTNFVTALGLDNIAAGWSTLENLQTLINDHPSGAVYAEVDSNGVLQVGVKDPTGTFELADDSTDAMLTELGLDTASTTFGPAYDVTVNSKSMSGGGVPASFSSATQIFDSFGQAHDVLTSFIKIGNNEWAYEIYAVNEDEVTAANGLITSGIAQFDGTGSLNSTSGLANVSIAWTNGAVDSEVDFGFTATQFAGLSRTLSVNQDGLPLGELAGFSTNNQGFVTALFTNGVQRALFQIPLANFPNPDGLSAQSGGGYIPTDSSGEVTLQDATTNGTGSISERTLEGSTADTATEFTSLITVQRAFSANARIITVADELLEEVTNIVR